MYFTYLLVSSGHELLQISVSVNLNPRYKESVEWMKGWIMKISYSASWKFKTCMVTPLSLLTNAKTYSSNYKCHRKKENSVGREGIREEQKIAPVCEERVLDWSERSGDRRAFQRTAWQNDVGVWVGKVCYCKELTEVFLVDAFPGKRIAMVCFLTAFTVGLLDYPNACLSAFPKSIT